MMRMMMGGKNLVVASMAKNGSGSKAMYATWAELVSLERRALVSGDPMLQRTLLRELNDGRYHDKVCIRRSSVVLFPFFFFFSSLSSQRDTNRCGPR